IASAASSTGWFGSRSPVFAEIVNRIWDAASGGDAPFPPFATTGDGLGGGTSAGVVGGAGGAASAGCAVSRESGGAIPSAGPKASVSTCSFGTPSSASSALTASIIGGGPQRWTCRPEISGTACAINSFETGPSGPIQTL